MVAPSFHPHGTSKHAIFTPVHVQQAPRNIKDHNRAVVTQEGLCRLPDLTRPSSGLPIDPNRMTSCIIVDGMTLKQVGYIEAAIPIPVQRDWR